MSWTGHVERIGELGSACSILVGKSAGNRTVGRPRRRWEDNIKMDLKEICLEYVNWLHLDQDRDN
jgi:hypothetical protein